MLVNMNTYYVLCLLSQFQACGTLGCLSLVNCEYGKKRCILTCVIFLVYHGILLEGMKLIRLDEVHENVAFTLLHSYTQEESYSGI